MGLGERVCGRGLAVRGGTEGLVDKGLALRGGTGGAFRSRHSSLTWHGKEHRGLDGRTGPAVPLRAHRSRQTRVVPAGPRDGGGTQGMPEAEPVPPPPFPGQMLLPKYRRSLGHSTGEGE